MFREFFKNGIINKWCNKAYICLFSKKKKTFMVCDSRPISLVASLYKIISKVLIKKLKEVLSFIINDTQATFVEGR